MVCLCDTCRHFTMGFSTHIPECPYDPVCLVSPDFACGGCAIVEGQEICRGCRLYEPVEGGYHVL